MDKSLPWSKKLEKDSETKLNKILLTIELSLMLAELNSIHLTEKLTLLKPSLPKTKDSNKLTVPFLTIEKLKKATESKN